MYINFLKLIGVVAAVTLAVYLTYVFYIIYNEERLAWLMAGGVGLNALAAFAGLASVFRFDRVKASLIRIAAVSLFFMNIICNIMIRGFTEKPPYVIMLNATLFFLYAFSMYKIFKAQLQIQPDSPAENPDKKQVVNDE